MDRAIQFSSSIRGTDKLFMSICYISKLIPSTRLSILADRLAETRVVLRYAGLLSMFKWIKTYESSPPDKNIWLGRLQNLANVGFYVGEQAAWYGRMI